MGQTELDPFQIIWRTAVVATALLSGGGLTILGIVWSPLGFMYCRETATERGYDRGKLGIAAIAYSILLFWPYVLFDAKLKGLPLPQRTMTIGYIILYICWAISILCSWFHGLVWIPNSGLYNFIPPLALLASAGISTALWWITLFQLNRAKSSIDYSVSIFSKLVRPFLFAFSGMAMNNFVYFLLYFR